MIKPSFVRKAMNGDRADDIAVRIEQFTQVYRVLDQFPLFTDAEVEKFFVPYGRETLIRLQRDINALKDNGKLIFTGHRGCGVYVAGSTREKNACG